MLFKNKKGAIEMSMGTIVTIVLVVVTLVLALVLVRNIFQSGTNAVENIDSAIQDQINKLFASEGKNLVIYPASQSLTLKRGDTPKGFAFSVKNDQNNQTSFSYSITAMSIPSDCGPSMTQQIAQNYILGSSGSFQLGPSQVSSPQLVKFNVPESAPECTVIYYLQVVGPVDSDGSQMFVTFK